MDKVPGSTERTSKLRNWLREYPKAFRAVKVGPVGFGEHWIDPPDKEEEAIVGNPRWSGRQQSGTER